MPFAEIINSGLNTRLFYRLEGQSDLPALVLSHSLGCDHSMWTPQMPDLLQHFQVLRYDTRGHGASSVPDGDYTLDQLGQDVLGLADRLGLAKFAFCGLSMGGAVGQWLAINAPQRLTRLVLANTSPKFGTPDVWNARIKAVQEGGMQAIVEAIMQRFFTQENQTQENQSPDKQESTWAQSTRAVLLGSDPQRLRRVLRRAARCRYSRSRSARYPFPRWSSAVTRIPPLRGKATARYWRATFPSAKAFRLQTAHLSNLEQPRAFTMALLDFLLART